MMELPRKTSGVAKMLGINYAHLFGLIRAGRMPRPRTDESGDYVWFPQDVANARAALAAPRKRRRTACPKA